MKRFLFIFSVSIFVISSLYLWQGFLFSFQQELVAAKELQSFEQSLSKYDPPVELVPNVPFAKRGETVAISAQKNAPAKPKTVPAKPIVPAKTPNKLVVKSMNVDTTILEGKSATTLHKGIWRLPGTATPDKGGNVVIAAHRWKWLPVSKKSFYDIDKVKVGDPIEVTWNGAVYKYKVTNIKTVTPDKVEILQNTPTAKLTLFSCAPLFSTKYRLVVEADLVS